MALKVILERNDRNVLITYLILCYSFFLPPILINPLLRYSDQAYYLIQVRFLAQSGRLFYPDPPLTFLFFLPAGFMPNLSSQLLVFKLLLPLFYAICMFGIYKWSDSIIAGPLIFFLSKHVHFCLKQDLAMALFMLYLAYKNDLLLVLASSTHISGFLISCLQIVHDKDYRRLPLLMPGAIVMYLTGDIFKSTFMFSAPITDVTNATTPLLLVVGVVLLHYYWRADRDVIILAAALLSFAQVNVYFNVSLPLRFVSYIYAAMLKVTKHYFSKNGKLLIALFVMASLIGAANVYELLRPGLSKTHIDGLLALKSHEKCLATVSWWGPLLSNEIYDIHTMPQNCTLVKAVVGGKWKKIKGG